MASTAIDLRSYLAECQRLTLAEIRRLIGTADEQSKQFYSLMLDYPMRAAKGLRPALCIATCRAFGGGLEAALPSAAVLELYHNAFLIHDDVEDASEQRRDRPTLHVEHGVPIAINVGDGMLALALTPLLENTRVVGLGKALRIIQVIARMARETAEGQAIELDWIRTAAWTMDDDAYRAMVIKKTGWYSFITPISIGAIIAGAGAKETEALLDAARELSIAFQIRDDVLNLRPGDTYGKELDGDLWEGKRTLVLLHALRHLAPTERARAEEILRKPRCGQLADVLASLESTQQLTSAGRRELESRLGLAQAKTADDIALLRRWIEREGSIEYASSAGREHARRAREAFRGASAPRSIHREMIETLIDFTVDRDH